MIDLLIPVARKLVVNPGSHPLQKSIPNASFIRRNDIGEMSHAFGGRSCKPTGPVIMTAADGVTPIVILADGETEVAELEDIAQEAYEKSQDKLKKHGNSIAFDEFRERTGKMRKEDVASALGNALLDRIDRHKKNSRTDPAREG